MDGSVHTLLCPAGNLSCITGFYQQLADGYELLSALPTDININADWVTFALGIEGYPHHHRGVPADGRMALISRGVMFWQIVPLVHADGRTTFRSLMRKWLSKRSCSQPRFLLRSSWTTFKSA